MKCKRCKKPIETNKAVICPNCRQVVCMDCYQKDGYTCSKCKGEYKYFN
ncbi:MAG: hypothetical protein RR248_01260 [Clostridia bacterium]